MPDYEEIIKSSQSNVNALSERLRDFEVLHQNIVSLKEAAEAIPKVFSAKFQEITSLSQTYMTTLGVATQEYLDGNNIMFASRLDELSKQAVLLDVEVSRLANIDLIALFEGLQDRFIIQARADLAVELQKFDDQSKALQKVIDGLGQESVRLAKIDLEKPFDKLQKVLSDIFGAINSINQALTKSIQTSTEIVQTLGKLQSLIDGNHKEVRDFISTAGDKIVSELNSHHHEAMSKVNSMQVQIDKILDENIRLGKDVRSSKIIQVVSCVLLVLLGVYLAFR